MSAGAGEDFYRAAFNVAVAQRDALLVEQDAAQRVREAAVSLRRYLADHGYVNEFKATGIPFIAALDMALAAEPAAAMSGKQPPVESLLDADDFAVIAEDASLVVPQPGSEDNT
jgi:hypothetical protein